MNCPRSRNQLDIAEREFVHIDSERAREAMYEKALTNRMVGERAGLSHSTVLAVVARGYGFPDTVERMEAVLGAAQAGQVIGAGAAVFLLLVVWFMGFVALSAVWFMTRRKDAR